MLSARWLEGLIVDEGLQQERRLDEVVPQRSPVSVRVEMSACASHNPTSRRPDCCPSVPCDRGCTKSHATLGFGRGLLH